MSVFQRSGPRFAKENASTRKLKPPFRRWRKRSGGPDSPALRHLRELEIENHRLRALGQNARTGSHVSARKTLSQKSSQFLRQDFGCGVVRRRNLPRHRAEHPLAGLDPFAVRADTRRADPRCSDDGLNGEVSDGVCAGSISTAIVRYLPAVPGELPTRGGTAIVRKELSERVAFLGWKRWRQGKWRDLGSRNCPIGTYGGSACCFRVAD